MSFIGFTPVENPQIMLYVVVDEPNLEDQEGSGAGAKLFNQVMSDLLPYLNVYATNSEDVAYDGTEEPLTSTIDEDATAEDTSVDDAETIDETDDSYTDDTSDGDVTDDSYVDDTSGDDSSYTDAPSDDSGYTDDSYTDDTSGDESYPDDGTDYSGEE